MKLELTPFSPQVVTAQMYSPGNPNNPRLRGTQASQAASGRAADVDFLADSADQAMFAEFVRPLSAHRPGFPGDEDEDEDENEEDLDVLGDAGQDEAHVGMDDDDDIDSTGGAGAPSRTGDAAARNHSDQNGTGPNPH